MMNFIMLTVSFTVAILLSGVISTVVMFKLMGNPKVVKWFMNYYMNLIEKSVEGLDEEFSKELAPN